MPSTFRLRAVARNCEGPSYLREWPLKGCSDSVGRWGKPEETKHEVSLPIGGAHTLRNSTSLCGYNLPQISPVADIIGHGVPVLYRVG